ncbi:hypothetical protein ABID25_006628 [Mesorhizobium abyssinicae]
MEKVTIVGVDLAKNVFQLHGATADGTVVFRKKLSRLQFCKFMVGQPPCVVAMEARAGSHYWANRARACPFLRFSGLAVDVAAVEGTKNSDKSVGQSGEFLQSRVIRQ